MRTVATLGRWGLHFPPCRLTRPTPNSSPKCSVGGLGGIEFPKRVLRKMTEFAETLEVKRKRSVFRRGEPGPGLFLVKSGEFKLSLISSEGREQILYLAEPGKLVGEGFLPRDVQCAASAFAMVDSEVWRFDTESMVKLISSNEDLGAGDHASDGVPREPSHRPRPRPCRCVRSSVVSHRSCSRWRFATGRSRASPASSRGSST